MGAGWNLAPGVSPDEVDDANETCRCCATCANGDWGEDMWEDERYCCLMDDYVPAGHACGFWKEG